MKRSTERILTTHVGSLPRPADLRAMWAKKTVTAEDEAALQTRCAPPLVKSCARRKAPASIFLTTASSASPCARPPTGAPGAITSSTASPASRRLRHRPSHPTPLSLAQPMRIVGVRWEQREFAEFYADTGLGAPSTAALRPTCTGPIAYTAQQFLRDQLVNLKLAANAAGVEEAFVSAIAPGSLEMFCRDQNSYYPTTEKFLEAIADAMREEYRAIVDAGFILQLDDPGLPGAWDMLDPQPSVEDYRRYASQRVEILNHALEGIPVDRVRYHICWGSWHGPHTTDFPLRDIVDVMLRVNAQAYLIEAGNVRHEHEFKVWRDVKLPAGKILIPGVVSHSTDLVEHPELVADRIITFAEIVGRENVIAGTDCGLGGRVHPQIAWAKLRALSDGAAIASKKLWS